MLNKVAPGYMHLYKFEQLQTPFTDAIAQQYMFTAFSYISTQNYIERMGNTQV